MMQNEQRLLRRQTQPLRRHQIDEGIVQGWHGLVHRIDDLLILMGARDGQHTGMSVANAALLDTEATRDDNTPVGGHGLPDRVQALLLGAVEKAARVDYDHIGAAVVLRDQVAFRAQLRDDSLAVDECLGAAKRHEADLGHAGLAGAGGARVGVGKCGWEILCHGLRF